MTTTTITKIYDATFEELQLQFNSLNADIESQIDDRHSELLFIGLLSNFNFDDYCDYEISECYIELGTIYITLKEKPRDVVFCKETDYSDIKILFSK